MMMGLPRYAAAALAACLVLPVLAAPKPAVAQASQASPMLVKLQSLVSNLGYNVTMSRNGQSIGFTLSGDYNYDVVLDLSQDNTLAYVFFHVVNLSSAQLANFPWTKLLEFNDTTDAYFSMESQSNGGESLYFDSFFPTAGLTPQILRDELTSFQNHADTSSSIWSSYTSK